MASQDTSQNVLSTWQEIADHLGVSVRTAQNYERLAGLPVRRMPGTKGRVVAYGADLDQWKANQLAVPAPEDGQSAAQAPELPSSQQSTIPTDTATPTDERQEQQQRIVPEPAQRDGRGNRLSSPVIVSLVVSAAALVGLVLLVASPHVFAGRLPMDYRVEVSTLTALDAEGREVWRRQFPTPFFDAAYNATGARQHHGMFSDLDGDGQVEMLFVPVQADQRTGNLLICYTQSGKKKWRFVPGRPIITDASGGRFSPPYFISSVQVIKNPDKRQARIAISSNHHMDAPDQVAILNSAGQLTGEFWHPGHLLYMSQAALDHDGKKDLLIAGVNNSYHAATFLVFDPANVSGTSSYYTDRGFQLVGFGPGSQKASVLFPRTCIGNHKPYNRVSDINIIGNIIYATVTEDVSEASSHNILYRLDFSLNVLAVDPTAEYREAHREMHRTGKLDHELNAHEIDGWKEAVVVIKQP